MDKLDEGRSRLIKSGGFFDEEFIIRLYMEMLVFMSCFGKTGGFRTLLLERRDCLATTRLMSLHVGKGQTAGDAVKRALGFVYFDQDKERSFTNYKGSRSDLMIEASELDLSQIRRCKVFNYTPLSFEFDYPIAKAAELALAEAHSAGVMTAFDSNYRFPYEDMKVYHAVQDAIYSAQILKLSQDDIRYFMKEENVFSACEKLLAGNAKIVAFTMGTSGSLLYTHKGWSYRPAYRVNALDTTGAGDSFMGALIYLLTHETDNIEELSVLDLERIGDFCNACAAASTMKRGSLLVMPALSQIEHVLKTAPRIETQFDKIHKTF